MATIYRQVSLSDLTVQQDFLVELSEAITASSFDFAVKSPNCKPTSFPCGRSCQPAKSKSGKPTKCNPEEFRRINEAFTKIRGAMNFAESWDLVKFQESVLSEFNKV